ncbi:MAG: hypothetical protein ABI651_02100 [Verrucomicrobiota bacterium]
MEDLFEFGSPPYCLYLGLLVFARGMDFLSTWIATPNLVLEANPIARKLGWRLGLVVNAVVCVVFALWALPAIVVATSSLLVASRNFQSAWLMRTLGEERYRTWISEHLAQTSLGLYLFCLLAQTFLVGSLGAGLMYFSNWALVPFAVGMGIITYAVAVSFYTLLSVRRIRRPVV